MKAAILLALCLAVTVPPQASATGGSCTATTEQKECSFPCLVGSTVAATLLVTKGTVTGAVACGGAAGECTKKWSKSGGNSCDIDAGKATAADQKGTCVIETNGWADDEGTITCSSRAGQDPEECIIKVGDICVKNGTEVPAPDLGPEGADLPETPDLDLSPFLQCSGTRWAAPDVGVGGGGGSRPELPDVCQTLS